MILMPIVYVGEMDESVAFYEGLGFDPKSRRAYWKHVVLRDPNASRSRSTSTTPSSTARSTAAARDDRRRPASPIWSS
jgi:hypothetical protein